MTKHACDHWRTLGKAGSAHAGRIVNTTSGSGMYGNVGQSAYAAAKAADREPHHRHRARDGPLRRHRQRYLPVAATRMTDATAAADGRDRTWHPRQLVAGLAYLASALRLAHRPGAPHRGQRRASRPQLGPRTGRAAVGVGRAVRRGRARRRSASPLRHAASRARRLPDAGHLVSGDRAEVLSRFWAERIPFNALCRFAVTRWDVDGVSMEVDQPTTCPTAWAPSTAVSSPPSSTRRRTRPPSHSTASRPAPVSPRSR